MTCPFTGNECYYGATDDDTCSYTGGECYYGDDDAQTPED